MNIEIVYGYTDRQTLLSVDIDENDSIEDAINKSGILQQFDDIDLSVNKVGVFGKISKLTSTLNPGDRIEIYRPLIADPKEVRRRRAAEGKKMKKGGGELEQSEAATK
ncbi:MAG: RnfH family protein [Gammaproteobacteria bacterium]|nr:RnfH family protein [Gammaproteobacteria bacterium]